MFFYTIIIPTLLFGDEKKMQYGTFVSTFTHNANFQLNNYLEFFIRIFSRS